MSVRDKNVDKDSNERPVHRGAFIVVEGPDCSGKTTQCRLLREELISSGSPAVSVRFPDRTTYVGSMIDQYLTGKMDLDSRVAHLLFSANRWENVKKLEHLLLSEGQNVICDRYAYSGVAYTAAILGQEHTGWCRFSDMGLPAPDVVILLDVSQDETERREGYGSERYEEKELQIKVRREFVQLKTLDETNGRVSWHVIPASQSIEKVQFDIQKIVRNTMREIENGKRLGKIWEEGEYIPH